MLQMKFCGRKGCANSDLWIQVLFFMQICVQKDLKENVGC